jgi:hypothetical protein
MALFIQNIADVVRVSNDLLVASEPLMQYEQAESFKLRQAILGQQRDCELATLLLNESVMKRNDAGGETSQLLQRNEDAFLKVLTRIRELLDSFVTSKTIEDLWGRLDKTEKALHKDIVPEVTQVREQIESARLDFNRALRSVWQFHAHERYRFSSKLDSKSTLLSSFHQLPFGIGATDDVFMSSGTKRREDLPDLESYQSEMQQVGEEWLKIQTKGSSDAEALVRAQNALMELTWSGQAHTLDKVDPQGFYQEEIEFPTFTEGCRHLTDGMRDSLLRYQSSTHTVLFVGTEDSGKSTFVNAFMGIDLLPAGGE